MLLFYTYYVVKEIARVSKACEALDAGNIELLGQLLLKTHDGLSREYEWKLPKVGLLVGLSR
jgi:galactokinase